MADDETGAASTGKGQERTISFYEIVRYRTTVSNEQMEQVDWVETLTFLADKPLVERTKPIGSQLFIGEILFYDEKPHLKLLKVRDVQAWLGIYNGKEKSVEDMAFDETNQLYETSIVSFLEFGNVLGIIQGSTAAPTATAVCDWIEAMGVFGAGVSLATQAVVSGRALAQLQQSTEVSRIETTISTTKAKALEARGSKLSGVLRTVNDQFGPMKVTLILKTSKAKDNTEGRQLLRAEASHLAAAASENEVSRAKAQLVFFEADETSKSKDVDFVKQRITAKRKIGAVSDDGTPIRNKSAVQAIVQVAAEHEEDLRAAVGAEKKQRDT